MFSIAINNTNSKNFSLEAAASLREKISQCIELEIRISQKTGRRDAPQRATLLAEIAKAQALLSLFTGEDEIAAPEYDDRHIIADRLWDDALDGDKTAFLTYLVDRRPYGFNPYDFFSREEIMSMQEHVLGLNPAPEIKHLFRWLTQS